MRRGVRASKDAKVLPGNQFIACTHTNAEVRHSAEAFVELLSDTSNRGIGEQPLLNWIGESTARISLLAHAAGHLRPDFVARELILGDMRADFALLSVPKTIQVAPSLLLVECQGALSRTLFETGNRTLHYWGTDFLDGFSQLVDWQFTEQYVDSNQKIATLTKDCQQPLKTSFLLVAGLRRFASDCLSVRRLQWWAKRISLGSNFQVKRFDDVAHESAYWARLMAMEGSQRDQNELQPLTLRTILSGSFANDEGRENAVLPTA